jgi:cytochrome b561
VFAALLRAHIIAAYLLYATFAAHLAGVLWHTLVVRDGVLFRMTFGRARNRVPVPVE